MLYTLTSVFFAASYPRRGQLALLLMTISCYLLAIQFMGAQAGQSQVRKGWHPGPVRRELRRRTTTTRPPTCLFYSTGPG